MQSGGSSSAPTTRIVESVENQSTIEVELDWNDIDADPGKRKSIEAFDVAIRDRVRREYLVRGPCQPIRNTYPKKKYGIQERSFQDAWFTKFPWLEYSESKNAAFCFWCYLFKQSDKGGRYVEDAFTKTGFNNWKNALQKFNQHVGAANSCHNYARIQFEAFQDQRHSVANVFRANTRKAEVAYRVRLTASLDELANACASEVILAIVKDIGDRVFTILVDEARDVSLKEQMGVVLRYVNSEGYVIERFFGIVHVTDTCSRSLKNAIDDLLSKHNSSLSRVRGQGYDGASNMRASYKRKDQLRKLQQERLVVQLNDEEVTSARGQNQESSLVVDLIIQEMNNRFSEASTDLLKCIACLDLRNSFSEFNEHQVIHIATLYPDDFSASECLHLPRDLGSFAMKMVKTKKHLVFPLVYRIIELTLVLPVATASIERAFSAMKTIKTELRNRMGDEWMNDSLVVYIEKDIFSTIDNEPIPQRFQSTKTRRIQLPPL
ncbi:uncharacterized protein LOC121774438 [Salvia splendens]|uniref:uncharacterized protein LOC121774438 n=1 Tax=Salvia splendens TaxID=180675 RepID=UPI001C27887E|nr:uncharacterized protein LOC121774438 [Salvia splendens]